MQYRFRLDVFLILGCIVVLVGFQPLHAPGTAMAATAEATEGATMNAATNPPVSVGNTVEKIAFFAAKGPKASALSIVDLDGKNVQPLIPSGALIARPAWSPDGKLIAFLLNTPTDTWDLVVAGSDGSKSHKVSTASSSNPNSFAWSPNSTQLIFVSDRTSNGGPGLYKVNVDGSSEQKLNVSGLDSSIFVGAVYWFPDGQHIIFPGKLPGDTTTQLLIANADGSGIKAYLSGLAIGGAFSPDGKHIAYFNFQNVMVADADGNNAIPVTTAMNSLFTQFVSWSPDSKRLAFTSSAVGGLNGILYLANADGSGVQKIDVQNNPALSMLGVAWGAIPADLIPQSVPPATPQS